MLEYLIVLPVMIVHMKTGNVKESAIAWGIIVALLFFFFIKLGIVLTIVSGVSGFVIAALLFSFANYLEENIFLRLFALFFGVDLMFRIPSFMVAFVAEYLK